MKCPHCRVSFHDDFSENRINWKGYTSDTDGEWTYRVVKCPDCKRFVIFFNVFSAETEEVTTRMVHPKGTTRPVPPEVPSELAADYTEACLVFDDSPKASAALSRRVLQHLLHGKGYTQEILNDQITAVLKSNTLFPTLAGAVDAIRNYGNFAAHLQKSKDSGLILDVEPGEAEWSLDTLESLFDFYFVAPAHLAAKQAALNDKLKEAGKPPMK